MNTDTVNKWLALVANLAVAASIVFLVLELNQNSRMMKTQTRTAITESILNFQFNASSSGMLELAAKGNADAASLSPVELQKVFQYYVSNLRLWENIHYQYRSGLFDEAEFNAERSSWQGVSSRAPLLRSVYCNLRQRGSLSPGFAAEMDTLIHGDCGVPFDLAPAAGSGQP